MAHYVITGATQGIGREVVTRLAALGHQLTVVGRDRDALEELAASGLASSVVVTDLASPASVSAALPAEVSEGDVDGLAHVAGVCYQGLLADADPAAWSRQLDINVVAPVALTAALLPALRRARATVVFLNSVGGLRVSGPTWSPYAASKHALRAVAEGLRLEEPDLRVASVMPGRVATGMQRAVRAFEGGTYDARDYLEPGVVADIVVDLLTAPSDRVISDITVTPRRS